MPQIDDAAQHHKDIPNLMKELGAIGALGPYIPEEYGGAGFFFLRPNFLRINYARVRTWRFCCSFCSFCTKFFGLCFPILSLVQKNKNANIFQN